MPLELTTVVMPGSVPFRTAPSVISLLSPPPCWFAPVAGQIEGSDLAATVAQGFEGAHRSADHFVEITSRTVFAVDLCIARKHHGGAYLVDRPWE